MNEEQLASWVEEIRPFLQEGQVASYIPALADANFATLGISISLPDGSMLHAGDCSSVFTLQSISKVITLMLALSDQGIDRVFERVGMEPTGDPFNSIIKLETSQPSKPLNPMINAGAIAVCSMVKGNHPTEKLERIFEIVRRMTGRNSVYINESIYDSELKTGDRNRALAYFMKEYGVIEGDIEPLLQVYFGQCSIEVNCSDVARIGLCLAQDGVNYAGERIVPAEMARIAKTFMVTCGMYNASGEFAMKVGIPAKSGVSGGILALVPHQLGVGVIGPALDSKGNSVGGVKLLERCSQAFSWSIF